MSTANLAQACASAESDLLPFFVHPTSKFISAPSPWYYFFFLFVGRRGGEDTKLNYCPLFLCEAFEGYSRFGRLPFLLFLLFARSKHGFRNGSQSRVLEEQTESVIGCDFFSFSLFLLRASFTASSKRGPGCLTPLPPPQRAALSMVSSFRPLFFPLSVLRSSSSKTCCPPFIFSFHWRR